MATTATKHTPGPWHLRGDSRRYEIVGETPIGDTDPLAVCENAGTGNVANARLIAAAPDLLAACEAAILPLMRLGDFIGNDDKNGPEWAGRFDRCEIIGQIRAAIAKAGGAA